MTTDIPNQDVHLSTQLIEIIERRREIGERLKTAKRSDRNGLLDQHRFIKKMALR
jgi:hypothetical protein